MGENRVPLMSKEEDLTKRIQFMMDHWDELPERLAGKVEGIVNTVADLVSDNKKAG